MEQHTDAVSLPINRGYYALSSTLRAWFVAVAAMTLIHFFAPENSLAGQVLVETVQSPSFFIALSTVLPCLAFFYYLRLANTYRLALDDDLLLSKGNMVHQCTRLKKQKISHSELNQGALERCFGLMTVKVYTPGTKAPILVLPNIHTAFKVQLSGFGIDV